VIAAAQGSNPAVEIFGTDYDTPDGTAVRDYVHVSDLAATHLKALDRLLAGGTGASVNLGTLVETTSQVEQVEIMRRALRETLSGIPWRSPNKKHPRATYCATTGATNRTSADHGQTRQEGEAHDRSWYQ
jgi:UDP-glucose 4-epimerase